jgi:hypothetical protein
MSTYKNVWGYPILLRWSEGLCDDQIARNASRSWQQTVTKYAAVFEDHLFGAGSRPIPSRFIFEPVNCWYF